MTEYELIGGWPDKAQVSQDAIDYREGMQACDAGEPCPAGASEAFKQGYAEAYADGEYEMDSIYEDMG